MLGVTDVPVAQVRQDRLGLQTYCQGLADFIERCPTPMTIALQGDWGTGKTSAIRLVDQLLEGRPATPVRVTFNTWRYAQFDLGDDLAFHLVGAILRHIRVDPADREQFLGKFRRITGRVIKASATAAARTATSVVAGEVGRAGFDAGLKEVRDLQEEPLDRVGDLEDLRRDFAALIAKTTPGEDSRAVVFIDDLDRLRPAKAVEVMEVLKTLLDVPRCVFVLAIDFAVVAQGVREKYGEAMDLSKANAFFDKIIQVPFAMPTASYDTASLVADTLHLAEGEHAEVAELMELSIGRNPRSVKRVLNAVALNQCVQGARTRSGGGEGEAATGHVALLAGALLQAAYPGFQSQLTLSDSAAKQELAQALRLARGLPEGADEAATDEQWDRWGVAAVDRSRFLQFVPLYIQASRIASLQELEAAEDVTSVLDEGRLAQVVQASAATASSRQVSPARVQEGAVDLASRVQHQRERAVSEGILTKISALEASLVDRFDGFSAREVAAGNGWRWYAAAQDGRRNPQNFCHVLFHKDPSVTLYIGNRSGKGVDRVRAVADQLRAQGWVFEEGAASSNLFLHLKKHPENADFTRLEELLAVAYESSAS